jgi:hypothetical protein
MRFSFHFFQQAPIGRGRHGSPVRRSTTCSSIVRLRGSLRPPGIVVKAHERADVLLPDAIVVRKPRDFDLRRIPRVTGGVGNALRLGVNAGMRTDLMRSDPTIAKQHQQFAQMICRILLVPDL